ncbi:MAG: hypothetical protein AAF557_23580 [Pseudomonadota bacterium]
MSVASDPPSGRIKAAAPETTAQYMEQAVEKIDGAFGVGYAREHPELLAAMVQAAAIEAAIEAGREAHGQAMVLADRVDRELCETILKMKPRCLGKQASML